MKKLIGFRFNALVVSAFMFLVTSAFVGALTGCADHGDGVVGLNGAQGDKGDKGDKGETGAQGDKGETGATGPQGPQGEPGEDGDDGEDAVLPFEVCTSAADCVGTEKCTSQGLCIEPGATGPQGPQGEPGEDGDDGEDAVLPFEPCSSDNDCDAYEDCNSQGLCLPQATTECASGQVQTSACGLNNRGSQTRVCGGNGSWGAWGSCNDSDVCVDGYIRSIECGPGHVGLYPEEKCINGQWVALDSRVCNNDAQCTVNETQHTECGLNNNGNRVRTCTSSRTWGAWGSCNDPDVCVNGALETQSCGTNNAGTRQRTCTGGQWANWGTCTMPQGELVTITVTSPQLAEAHVYYGDGLDDYGNTTFTVTIPKSEACVWGAEVDLRVAKSIKESMPWYNCTADDANAPSFSGVEVFVNGTKITWTIVNHPWECGGNLAVTKAQLGCL